MNRVLLPLLALAFLLLFLPGVSGETRKIVISGNHPENYQIRMEIDWSELRCWGDFGDIRFFEENLSQPLSFWIENYTYMGRCTVWIRREKANSPEDNEIYLSYGNPNLAPPSNPYRTFLFFDHFDNLSNWVAYSGGYTLSGGILTVRLGGFELASPLGFPLENCLVESRARITETAARYSGVFAMTCSSPYATIGNTASDAAVIFTRYNVNSNLLFSNGVSGWVLNIDIGFPPTVGTWYIFGTSIRPNGFSLYRDGEELLSIRNVSWLKPMYYVKIGSFQRDNLYNIQDTDYDWIRVRKYVYPEPIASFYVPPSHYTLSYQVSGGGYLMVNENIYTGTGSLRLPADSRVTIGAYPDNGYRVSVFLIDGHPASNPSTIVMNKDYSVIAIFEKAPPFTLSYLVTSGGSLLVNNVTYTGSGILQFENGQTIFLKAIPNNGYVLSSFYVDGAPIDGDNFTLVMDASHSVAVFFSLKPPPPPPSPVPVPKFSISLVTEPRVEIGKKLPLILSVKGNIYKSVRISVSIYSDKQVVYENSFTDFTKESTYSFSIDTSGWKKGTYTIRASCDEIWTSKQVVVEEKKKLIGDEVVLLAFTVFFLWVFFSRMRG